MRPPLRFSAGLSGPGRGIPPFGGRSLLRVKNPG